MILIQEEQMRVEYIQLESQQLLIQLLDYVIQTEIFEWKWNIIIII